LWATHSSQSMVSKRGQGNTTRILGGGLF